MKDATHLQLKILEFIKAEIAQTGFPPTARRIQQHFGYKSNTAAVAHIKNLVKKGYLAKAKGWRCIKIIQKVYEVPPDVGYYWYRENNFATRVPVEIVRNGSMELIQLEIGNPERKQARNLKGKWEALSS